jgi:hypothetical protein
MGGSEDCANKLERGNYVNFSGLGHTRCTYLLRILPSGSDDWWVQGVTGDLKTKKLRSTNAIVSNDSFQ